MTKSEIANFKRQQVLQEEAGRQGLQGLAAGVSRHAFINHAMDRGAETILHLIEAGQVEQAHELWNSDTW